MMQFKIDQKATFAGTVFVSSQPKTKFGSQEQERTKDGIPKWTVEILAAVRDNFGGTRSELIKVGMTGQEDPGTKLNPFTPVELGSFEVGVMEKTKRGEDGSERVIGVTVWYRADELVLLRGAAAGEKAA